jgi:quercetin dioxygenase-like cupin family protein
MIQPKEKLVNPRTGQTMIFLQTAADTNGELLQVETINPRGGSEPEHVHPFQESRAEVLSGMLHFSIRGQQHVVRAGERIVIPPDTPHTFWNEGAQEARAIQEFRPALKSEDFFRSYFRLAQEGRLDENGMPSLLQLAILVPAFANEIRPTSPPWALLRAITLLLRPIAKARGYQMPTGNSPRTNTNVPSRT